MPRFRKRVTYSRRPNHAARAAHARGYELFKTYDTSYIEPKRKLPRWALILIIVVASLFVIWGIFSLVRSCSAQPTLAEGETVQVEITEGSTVKDIDKQLYDAGVIGNVSDFTNAVTLANCATDLKPGTYEFTGGLSIDDVVNKIRNGDTVLGVVVPEGATLDAISQAVETGTGGAVTASSFKEAASDASKYASDYDFLSEAGTNSLEGFLFPKTYVVNGDETADSLVREMLDQYRDETANLDYSYPNNAGLSKYDALKLASIVEKESDLEHMGTVASVFYNRIAQNLRLQSDATTAYEVGHNPTADDIAKDGAYNTYTNDGLPPTPICSPSLAALQAVCSPEQTNYLYFYFKQNDDGSTQYSFSETYEEHQKTYQ